MHQNVIYSTPFSPCKKIYTLVKHTRDQGLYEHMRKKKKWKDRHLQEKNQCTNREARPAQGMRRYLQYSF